MKSLFVVNMVVSLSHLTKICTGAETACVCFSSDGDLLTCHYRRIHHWSPHGLMIGSVTPPVSGTVNSVHQSPTSANAFVYAVDNAVVCCDSRNWSKPLHTFRCSRDEVNEVCYHPGGRFLCAGDDSGEVIVMDAEAMTLYQTLAGGHSNICAATVFSPAKPWELVSGGMDCRLLRWNFSIGRLVGETSVPGDLDEGGSFAVNPPFVCSIATLPPSGDSCLVACGLGNGAVGLYRLRGQGAAKHVTSSRLHPSSVARVCHVRRDSDDFLVSGSNDGRVVVSRVDCKERRHVISDAGAVSHDSKINWLAVSKDFRVCVADQTNFVSVYQIQ